MKGRRAQDGDEHVATVSTRHRRRDDPRQRGEQQEQGADCMTRIPRQAWGKT